MRRPGFETREISRITGSPSTYFSSMRNSETPVRICSRVKPRMYPSRFSTSSTLARIFEAGEATTAWRARCPLRIRVSMSPNGSLIVIAGILLPARLEHAWDLPRGGKLAQRNPRQLELPVKAARPAGQGAAVAHPRRRAVARQQCELELRCKTLLGRRGSVDRDLLEPSPSGGDLLGEFDPPGILLDRALFCHLAKFLAPSIRKRHVETLEQRLGLRIGSRRGRNHDVHPAHRIDAVVVDLGKDDLLLEAECEITTAIEALARNAAKVAYPRQRHVDQPVEKLVHALPAQGHLAADRHALAQLEGRNRPFGASDDRMLAGDRGQLARRGLDLFAVLHRLADAHIDHDLIEPRHLHRVGVAELLHQRRAQCGLVMILQPRLAHFLTCR